MMRDNIKQNNLLKPLLQQKLIDSLAFKSYLNYEKIIHTITIKNINIVIIPCNNRFS